MIAAGTALSHDEFVRLSRFQKNSIVDAVHRHDPQARVILFGSRVDDGARGGDIDLLVISDQIGMHEEWEIRRDILDRIGWQKLDLIVRRRSQLDSPIVGIALESGIQL